jgi:hypothetical protein
MDASLESGKVRQQAHRETGWTLAFAVNLPVPMFLAISCVDKWAGLGVIGALVVMAVLGNKACSRRDRPSRAVVFGGIVVAVLQLIPLLQVCAGTLALRAGAELGLATSSDVGLYRATGVLGGFLVTMLTGAQLIGVALVLGLFTMLITPSRWWGVPPGPDASTKPASDPGLDLDLLG